MRELENICEALGIGKRFRLRMYRMSCINIRGVSNVVGLPQTDAATILAANNAASVAVNFIKLEAQEEK